MIKTFISALLSQSLVKDGVYDPESREGYIESNNGKVFFKHSDKGFIISSGGSAEEYYPSKNEAALLRVLSVKTLGTADVKTADGHEYHDVVVFPKKIASDTIVFGTASGTEFILSSCNTRVTLGLYDILYAHNAEQSIMNLPTLLPEGSDVVEIASRKFGQYLVSPKTEYLTSKLTIQMVDGSLLCSSDAETQAKINRLYGDNTVMGQRAPLEQELVSSASSVTLQSDDKGYKILSGLELVNGLSYHLSGEIRPDYATVQQAISAENRLISEIESGVELCAEGKTLLASEWENLGYISNDIEPALKMGRYDQDPSQAEKIMNNWKLPITTSKVSSYTWG